MRAMVEARAGQDSRNTTLYTGHRSSVAIDAHYSSEFEELATSGFLRYHPVASRDGGEGVARRYVQDAMREDCNARDIWREVGELGGWVLISGSSNKMPLAVKAAIQNAAEKFGGKTEEEARVWVAALEREGRLIEECWS
jgi:sulfite reductase alpha subunit-like flavoprotein